ncbi:unnamed protein product [Rodentolepis nana]|uniref:Fibronectin type-III domain-containing protein n=1 Tax=Rodentolepis nana TaxID=102285 RepID=A0A0R3T3E9_RODNA|nr:unnamed protein product [Rodentolepis nana]
MGSIQDSSLSNNYQSVTVQINLNEQIFFNASHCNSSAYLRRLNVALKLTFNISIFRRLVPAPRGIAMEKQLTHSIIVSWKPPEFCEVTAYHVYADGQFRTSVGGHEKCRALVDNVDASKQHRISIRTVTGWGQSKDAECTLLVGKGASAAPTRLKASHITTNSAKLSWLPGSSNFYHAVFLNDHELRICPPGVYKLFLTGKYTLIAARLGAMPWKTNDLMG